MVRQTYHLSESVGHSAYIIYIIKNRSHYEVLNTKILYKNTVFLQINSKLKSVKLCFLNLSAYSGEKL